MRFCSVTVGTPTSAARRSSGSKKVSKRRTGTRLSCHRFRANEVRLQLSVLAYNLGNLWRRLGLPHRIKTWSLTSLQQRLMKTGGRLVKHARYYWLLLAEGTSEPAAVWRHAAEDLGAACAGWLAPHLANAKSVY